MKKKVISFLLLCAMVVCLLPAAQVKSAGLAYLFKKKTPNTVLTEKTATKIWVGEGSASLCYNISGKTSGITGKWTSSNTSAVTVTKKGVCKAVGNGTAIITFTYTDPSTKTTKSIKAKFKAVTKAQSITLSCAAPETDKEGFAIVKPGTQVQASAAMTTSSKALKVNKYATNSFNTYYYLYQDKECTKAADGKVAKVGLTDGVITGVANGTVYLQAEGKLSASASVKVKSNVVPIKVAVSAATTVEQISSTTFRVKSNDEIRSIIVYNVSGQQIATWYNTLLTEKYYTKDISLTTTLLMGIYNVSVNGGDKIQVVCSPAKVSRIELNSTSAVLENGSFGTSGFVKAYVYYTIFDQFGNDITCDPTFSAIQVFGFCTSQTATGQMSYVEPGVMSLQIPYSSTSYPKQGDVYTINLMLGDAKLENASVSLVNQTLVTGLDVKGVYCYQDAATGYVLKANTSVNKIVKDTVFTPYNNSMTTMGAYYLMVSAKDMYGNYVPSGSTNSGVNVQIPAGNPAGIMLATSAPIGSAVIDGVRCLVYPLAATAADFKPLVGETTITVYTSGAGTKTIPIGIAGAMAIKTIAISTGSIRYTKTNNNLPDLTSGITALSCIITNTANIQVKDYDQLLVLFGCDSNMVDLYKATGNKYFIPESYLKSSLNSLFYLVKNEDGTGSIMYEPRFAYQYQGATLIPYCVDEITILGTTKFNITQYIG